MDTNFLKIVEDIQTLRIQGATNIAVEGVKAFASLAERLDISSLEPFFGELEKARHSLATARATEPALRNGLRYIVYNLHENASTVKEAKEIVNSISNEYIQLLKDSKKKGDSHEDCTFCNRSRP